MALPFPTFFYIFWMKWASSFSANSKSSTVSRFLVRVDLYFSIRLRSSSCLTGSSSHWLLIAGDSFVLPLRCSSTFFIHPLWIVINELVHWGNSLVCKWKTDYRWPLCFIVILQNMTGLIWSFWPLTFLFPPNMLASYPVLTFDETLSFQISWGWICWVHRGVASIVVGVVTSQMIRILLASKVLKKSCFIYNVLQYSSAVCPEDRLFKLNLELPS